MICSQLIAKIVLRSPGSWGSGLSHENSSLFQLVYRLQSLSIANEPPLATFLTTIFVALS